MKQYQCRRKKRIDVHDEQTKKVVKNVIVLDAAKGTKLFDECVDCGYSSKGLAWDGQRWQGVAREVKLCTLREVKA